MWLVIYSTGDQEPILLNVRRSPFSHIRTYRDVLVFRRIHPICRTVITGPQASTPQLANPVHLYDPFSSRSRMLPPSTKLYASQLCTQLGCPPFALYAVLLNLIALIILMMG
jgi:hypothetical protein